MEIERKEDNLLGRIRGYAEELQALRTPASEVPEVIDMILNGLSRKFGKGVSIAALEEVVRKLKKREEQLSSHLLPEAMDECGMTEFSDSLGNSIVIDEKVRGSISQRNAWQVFDQVISRHVDNGMSREDAEALAREELSWSVTSDDPAVMEEISHLPHQVKLKPNPSRVSKLVREWLAAGEVIPEGVSWVQQRTTRLKVKKSKK